jgi:hypothetical protein
LLEHIDIEKNSVLANHGYDSQNLIDYIYEKGAEPTIPSKKDPNLSVIAIGSCIKSGI